jgi:adenosylmethionine-8-amino-7-oxononanoate aminotransferase
MAVAKGLGGGYMPLGATIYHQSVLEVIKEDGGPLTGHTFTAHTAACAAGAAVQRIVKREHLVAKVKNEGEEFKRLLREALSGIDGIGDIRGRGFFIGVEFVSDPSTRVPFEPAVRFSARFNDQALARGLLCYPVSGNVDGVSGDVAILAPPYIATRAELAEIVQCFTASVRATLRDVRRP